MVMQSFELQVYKRGKWEFDSYFDDREIALFEAERLHEYNRYSGIRVLEEQYHENSDTSDCTVIFSRLKKIENNSDSRTQATREGHHISAREAAKPVRRRKVKSRNSAGKGKARTRKSARSKSPASVYKLMAMAMLILIAGVGALVGLRYLAFSM